ncbi:DUF3224 domain-containing protein [Maritalea mediterranea]|uniref:DUF3224 domain-containing protein n=1 Tax=Maritalea mediterranea TaxID=2909667 RepID=A0ABS9E8D1_9HYPH|nr:DUF3224 domain-containing protein [Maritalea mediterranea]MCF4099131.1 DUF3224 domain-containing protein [Maritalea mediterranea]
MKLSGTYTHLSWDETMIEQVNETQKLSEALVKEEFDGDLQGSASIKMQLFYCDDATAHYHGFRLFNGSHNGKSGTMTILETGTWVKDKATTHWQIVDGSGTGAFEGAAGQGGYEAGHTKQVNWHLDVQI